jgi:hypothetical protein
MTKRETTVRGITSFPRKMQTKWVPHVPQDTSSAEITLSEEGEEDMVVGCLVCFDAKKILCF